MMSNKNIKILYLMCGLAFSGKSTIAKQLVKDESAACVSLDEIDADRGLLSGEGVAVEAWSKTLEKALSQVATLMRTGRNIVVDDTNCYRWIRDRYRDLAKRYGYKVRVFYLDVPLEVIYERMKKNEMTGARPPLNPEAFEEHYRTFEMPAKNEKPKVIRFDKPSPSE